uniref:DNA-processing protein DprA n=1 Tax=Acetatifactor sp. TaxID=1872090 RepID=UPI004057AD66
MEDSKKNKMYAYWLCNLHGIGNRSIEKLLNVCGGTPEAVYCASEKLWAEVLNVRQQEQIKLVREKWELEAEYDKLEKKGIRLLLQEETQYPQRLRNIPDAPYGLFYKGILPEEEQLSVAIIGARDCSQYGSYVATELGRYLGEKGVQIISGMARGIDGISQEAALAAGGTAFGVLGCGVDVCYPACNRKLYERLLTAGGILSTYPPGTEARPQHFPPRNRIVSGLADVVVVIEARNKSGTLITVDMALEQGKDVYVVPGRITDRLSDGCNSMIRQGAGVVLSPQDFYSEIMTAWEEKRGILQERIEKKREEREPVRRMVAPELRKIYEVLDWYPQSTGQIAEKVADSYSFVQVSTSLLRLCMEEAAVQISPGYFCRK